MTWDDDAECDQDKKDADEDNDGLYVCLCMVCGDDMCCMRWCVSGVTGAVLGKTQNNFAVCPGLV